MRKHFNIRVRGLVQGVFFRASTKEHAASLKISGLVRNEPDGSVYIEAEGEDAALKEFIQWCHHGPAHAVVDRCEFSEAQLKDFEGFRIER